MNRKQPARRGATVLEMSIILSMLLMLTMGILDLGVGVFRYHILSQSARTAARRAIVHGSQANVLGIWGPTAINSAANASGIPVIDAISPQLVGCDLSSTNVTVEWPDGDNKVGRRVKVTITSPYQPTLAFILPGGQITLTARTCMLIAH